MKEQQDMCTENDKTSLRIKGGVSDWRGSPCS